MLYLWTVIISVLDLSPDYRFPIRIYTHENRRMGTIDELHVLISFRQFSWFRGPFLTSHQRGVFACCFQISGAEAIEGWRPTTSIQLDIKFVHRNDREHLYRCNHSTIPALCKSSLMTDWMTTVAAALEFTSRAQTRRKWLFRQAAD